MASSRTTEIEIFSNISKYFQICLHGARDALPVAEDLVEVLGAEDVPEGGLGQQSRAGVSVLHVGHADGSVTDPVVHHRVHRHGDAVLGEDLLGRDAQRDGPEVHPLVGLDTGQYEEDSSTLKIIQNQNIGSLYLDPSLLQGGACRS